MIQKVMSVDEDEVRLLCGHTKPFDYENPVGFGTHPLETDCKKCDREATTDSFADMTAAVPRVCGLLGLCPKCVGDMKDGVCVDCGYGK
jgi:hypothetical protein